ncbi:MAG TPA: LytTR family DNA-binding domain-containing protein [Thermoanaerobaculia bacterium]|nr:LytTR family DNA-binding domain-containing protein [Thermoanaerobaculia bacterium]
MRIAIVEDEAIVARRLERMVRAISGATDVAVASTFEAAIALIRSRPIDVLFLDLNLNGRDGFALLEEAAASPFQTVVVSAHHEQALRAFEYGVTDFVAKPWSEERLRLAMERTARREPQRRATTIVVRKGRELRSVAVNNILYVKGADDYSELHLGDGTVHLHEKTLSALEALLPPQFLRVHRSYIANLGRVRGVRASSLVMKDDTLVPVGRVYRDAVRSKLGV